MSDPSVPYLGVGYGLFWAVIAAYIVRLSVAQRRVTRRLDELQSRRPAGDANGRADTETR